MGTSWTIVAEADDADTWDVDELASQNALAERRAWSVTPATLMKASNWAAEDFRFKPEDTELNPEDAQADNDDWTVEPGPS
jgi:hypothetical protein